MPVIIEKEVLPEPKQHVNVVFNFDRSDAGNIVGGVEDVRTLLIKSLQINTYGLCGRLCRPFW